MLINELIQAVTLFGLGMVTVFVLLTLLISCVSGLSLLCKKFESQTPVLQAAFTPQTKQVNSVKTISELEKSIVKAAVKAHREASV